MKKNLIFTTSSEDNKYIKTAFANSAGLKWCIQKSTTYDGVLTISVYSKIIRDASNGLSKPNKDKVILMFRFANIKDEASDVENSSIPALFNTKSKWRRIFDDEIKKLISEDKILKMDVNTALDEKDLHEFLVAVETDKTLKIDFIEPVTRENLLPTPQPVAQYISSISPYFSADSRFFSPSEAEQKPPIPPQDTFLNVPSKKNEPEYASVQTLETKLEKLQIDEQIQKEDLENLTKLEEIKTSLTAIKFIVSETRNDYESNVYAYVFKLQIALKNFEQDKSPLNLNDAIKALDKKFAEPIYKAYKSPTEMQKVTKLVTELFKVAESMTKANTPIPSNRNTL